MNPTEPPATLISNNQSTVGTDPAIEQHISNDSNTVTVDRGFLRELMNRAIMNNTYCTDYQPYSETLSYSSYAIENDDEFQFKVPKYDPNTHTFIYESLKDSAEKQIEEALKKESPMSKEQVLNALPVDIRLAYDYLMSKKQEYLGPLHYDYFKDGIKPDSHAEQHSPIDYIKKLIHSIIPSNIWNFYILHNRKFKSSDYKDKVYDIDLDFWGYHTSQNPVSASKNVIKDKNVNTDSLFSLRFDMYHNMGGDRADDKLDQLKISPTRFYWTLCFERGSRNTEAGSTDTVRRLGIYESIRMVLKSRENSNFIVRFLYIDPRCDWNAKFRNEHPISFNKLSRQSVFDCLPLDYVSQTLGYSDIKYHYSRENRIINIVSNKPLFTHDQLKLLTNIYKLVNSDDQMTNNHNEYSFKDIYNMLIENSEDGLDNIGKTIPKSNQTLLWLHQIILRDLWFDPNCAVQKLLKLISDCSHRNIPKKVITKEELNSITSLENDEAYQQHQFWRGLPKLERVGDNVIESPNQPYNVPLEAWIVDYSDWEILDPLLDRDEVTNTKFNLTNKLNNLKLPVDLVNQPWFVTMLNSWSYVEHLRNYYSRFGDGNSFNDYANQITPLRVEDYIDYMNLMYDSMLK